MAPRKSKTAAAAPPSRTLVLDNGASSIKAGFVSHHPSDEIGEPRVIPNCIARDRDRNTYVGSELDACPDFGELALRRPVDKGFIVNWEAQREIWEREFFDASAPQRCDPAETRLLLAEQPNALPVLQANCDQMVFEEFGFASYARVNGPSLNAYCDIQAIFRTPRAPGYIAQLPSEVVMIVDSGYSHTTVTPVLQGRPIHPAVRRLDVGGKLLTNYLTRLLSLRHYDMRNDTYIVNDIKEQASYVSLDFAADLDSCWKGTRGDRRPAFATNPIAKDYVLPDFHTRRRGILRDHDPEAASRARRLVARDEDILTLRNERFAVPEVLFHPADVGLRDQPGLPDLIEASLRALPRGLWPSLTANLIVVGGNACLPGLIDRLYCDLVERLPAECFIRVAAGHDPVLHTWRGAANLCCQPAALESLAVSKQEYEEYGSTWLARKFSGLH